MNRYRWPLVLGGMILAASGFAQDANWVHEVFEDALNRQETPVELAFYLSLLGSTTYTQVSKDIMVDPPTGDEYFGHFINATYNRYLGRNASSSDLSLYTPLLESGSITDDTVRTTVIASPEFFLDAGSDNGGFVDRMFLDALQRPPDSSTRAAYVSYLNGGGSRTVLATDVVEGSEFEGNLVDGFYTNYLDRSSDPSGRTTFVSALRTGTSEETVQSLMMGSTEYYTNAQIEAAPEPPISACLGVGFAGLLLLRRKI